MGPFCFEGFEGTVDQKPLVWLAAPHKRFTTLRNNTAL